MGRGANLATGVISAELQRQLKEIGSSRSCTPCTGVFCGLVQRPDCLLIVAGRGKCPVARSLFDVKLGTGDLPMHRSSLFRRCHAVYRRSEDRMGESDDRTVHLEDAKILGTVERSGCIPASTLT